MCKIMGELDSSSICCSHGGHGEVVEGAFSGTAPNDISADVIPEHPSDKDIRREVFACKHARSGNAGSKRVNHHFGSQAVVFRSNYVRERPCQNGVIGRHGLSIRPCLYTIWPDVSFTVSLHWRLPINRVSKRSI